MDSQKEAYKVEAYELLSELEASLLELEETPSDFDLVDRVFRAMHTIKGSGSMFGFDDIAEFTHDVESVFEHVREGRISVSTHLVNLSLRAADHIRAMLDSGSRLDDHERNEGRDVLQGFRTMLGELSPDRGAGTATANEEIEDASIAPDPGHTQILRIRFAPDPSLFRTGNNPLALIEELSGLGECLVTAHTDKLPDLDAFDPETSYLYWDILLTTDRGENAVRDVFIFIEDDCELVIDVVDNDTAVPDETEHKRLGEILVERGDLSSAELENSLLAQKRLGQVLVESEKVSESKIEAALAEQEKVQCLRKSRQQQASATSIRVAADKLDTLVNLVGELVTVQARLSQKAGSENDSELMAISEVVERLTAELRDNTLSIRMLPIDVTFNKLRRLVRDLSNELRKDITLNTGGGDTELDKTVLEQLNDPLIHILRNSIDHGIESPERRRKAGKPEQGTITLNAEHSGANVMIHIHDDGAGIDPEAIRQKAVEKGILAADAERSDKELLQLVFAPGLSTAASVTNVSGRGVGMDVVKQSIESLRGAIDISSTPGDGTEITLKLPLTLAIIDGLLVQIDTDHFVLPLSAIQECVEFRRNDKAHAHGRNILNIRNRIVPFVPLRERFAITSKPPDQEQVVISEVDGQRVGIVVDRVIGEHQIVIKTMNALYRDVQEISGATILGDGTVALILDVPKLLNAMEIEETAT